MPTLVVNQGAIGDLLLSLPALRLLRKARGEYTLVSHPTQGLFLKNIGEISSVIPSTAAALSELYVGSIPPHLAYFDDIWWFTRRRGLVPDVYLRPSQKWTSHVIFTVDESPDRTHCSTFQFNQVKTLLGMEEERMHDFVYPIAFSQEPSNRQLFDLAIHPGSGSIKKSWPVQNFLELAEAFLKYRQGQKLLFIIGPSEKELGDAIKGFVSKKKGQALYMESQDLLMTAETLGRTRIFIGNDSGISHLAAWCGADSLLLFGPTDPALWGPPLSNASIIKSPAQCSPCGDAYRKCQKPHCMEQISVPEVTKAVLQAG